MRYAGIAGLGRSESGKHRVYHDGYCPTRLEKGTGSYFETGVPDCNSCRIGSTPVGRVDVISDRKNAEDERDASPRAIPVRCTNCSFSLARHPAAFRISAQPQRNCPRGTSVALDYFRVTARIRDSSAGEGVRGHDASQKEGD